MAWTLNYAQLPDFGATWQRGQAFQQQREMTALAMQAQQRELQQADAFQNALMSHGPGFASPDDTTRQNALLAILQSGPQGARLALPLLQQERDNAAFFGAQPGATPLPTGERWAPPGSRAADDRGAPMVERVAAVESGGNPAARNPAPGSTAAGPLQITDAMWNTYAPRLNLSPEQRNTPTAQRAVFLAFARDEMPDLRRRLGREPTPADIYSSWAMGPGALRAFLAADPNAEAFEVYRRAAGDHIAEQAFASNPGLLTRGATVRDTLGAYARRFNVTEDPRSTTNAPAALPGGGAAAASSSSSTPAIDPAMIQRAVVLAARGNQAAARYLQAVAPFIRQETNSEVVQVPDDTSRTGFRYVRRMSAAGMEAPAPDGYRPGQGQENPFGTGGDGRALAELERLAPVVQAGNATEDQVRRYLSAANRVQEERVQPDGSRITPRLPAYAPGVDWVAQRYGVQRPSTAQEAPEAARPGTLPAAEGGAQRAPQQQPQAVATAMLENVRALRSAQDAVRQIQQTPGAFGMWQGATNLIPGALDRVNPSGVDARAAVADLASLKIHDLSGAAVSASEFARLRPFIPSVGDPPEVVKSKVQRFVREFEAVLRDQYSAFGPGAGYRTLDPVEQALRGQGGNSATGQGGGDRATAAGAIARARQELGPNASDDDVVRRAQELMR